MGDYEVVIGMLKEARSQERERACKIVRENCIPCDGSGIGGLIPGDAAQLETVECEYCGPVIHKIMED